MQQVLRELRTPPIKLNVSLFYNLAALVFEDTMSDIVDNAV